VEAGKGWGEGFAFPLFWTSGGEGKIPVKLGKCKYEYRYRYQREKKEMSETTLHSALLATDM